MARSCNPEPRLGDMVWISAGTLALGLTLALSYPVIYGGDTIIRIVNLPRIRISYQLPLLQILLRGALVVCNRPFAVWFLMVGVAPVRLGARTLDRVEPGARSGRDLSARAGTGPGAPVPPLLHNEVGGLVVAVRIHGPRARGARDGSRRRAVAARPAPLDGAR